MKNQSWVGHGDVTIHHREERTHVSILMFRVKVGFSAIIVFKYSISSNIIPFLY